MAVAPAANEWSARPASLVENPLPARTYPWGEEISEELANYDATRIGATSAVGSFPRGASPYGCDELAGNVWEWCRDGMDGGLVASKDAGVLLRVGSWNYPASYLTAANRSRSRDRGQVIGFRCVLVGFSEHD